MNKTPQNFQSHHSQTSANHLHSCTHLSFNSFHSIQYHLAWTVHNSQQQNWVKVVFDSRVKAVQAWCMNV